MSKKNKAVDPILQKNTELLFAICQNVMAWMADNDNYNLSEYKANILVGLIVAKIYQDTGEDIAHIYAVDGGETYRIVPKGVGE